MWVVQLRLEWVRTFFPFEKAEEKKPRDQKSKKKLINPCDQEKTLPNQIYPMVKVLCCVLLLLPVPFLLLLVGVVAARALLVALTGRTTQ